MGGFASNVSVRFRLHKDNSGTNDITEPPAESGPVLTIKNLDTGTTATFSGYDIEAPNGNFDTVANAVDAINEAPGADWTAVNSSGNLIQVTGDTPFHVIEIQMNSALAAIWRFEDPSDSSPHNVIPGNNTRRSRTGDLRDFRTMEELKNGINSRSGLTASLASDNVIQIIIDGINVTELSASTIPSYLSLSTNDYYASQNTRDLSIYSSHDVKEHRNDGLNGCLYLFGNRFDYRADSNGKEVEPLKSVHLEVNQDRFTNDNIASSYYRSVQPVSHCARVPRKGIYSYSFGMNASSEHQNGILNFSKIQDKQMRFRTNSGVNSSLYLFTEYFNVFSREQVLLWNEISLKPKQNPPLWLLSR